MIFLLLTAYLMTFLEGMTDTPVAADSAADSPVVIRFGGDVLLGGYYEKSVGENALRAFEGFKALAEADIAMVNLENPVTIRGTKVPKPYNFRMKPGFLRTLSDAGIKIVSIANNHIFDYGMEGFLDTISYLDTAGILRVGAGRNMAEAHRPAVFTIRGKIIGFLAYYGGGEAPGAEKNSAGVARRDLGQVTADILSLRHVVQADYIIVNLHWGTEKAETPDLAQRTFAHALIDAGADAVIGHHPHVLQGIEKYKSGVIAYSLGNLIFGGNSRSTYQTGLFEIRLAPDGPHYALMPVLVDGWRASLLTGVDSSAVAAKVMRLSTIFPSTIFTK